MDFDRDRLRELDEEFRAKRKASDDWARLAVLSVFENAVELDWLRLDDVMMSIGDGVLGYVTSTGGSEGVVAVKRIPIARIIGLDLELNTKWLSDRWFNLDADRASKDGPPLGEATIHLDYPSVSTIVIPMRTDDPDDPAVRFIASLEDSLSGERRSHRTIL